MAGIQETKEVINFIFSLAEAVNKSMEEFFGGEPKS